VYLILNSLKLLFRVVVEFFVHELKRLCIRRDDDEWIVDLMIDGDHHLADRRQFLHADQLPFQARLFGHIFNDRDHTYQLISMTYQLISFDRAVAEPSAAKARPSRPSGKERQATASPPSAAGHARH
jgi:hypothetical protein